jgi:hypothetical protein
MRYRGGTAQRNRPNRDMAGTPVVPNRPRSPGKPTACERYRSGTKRYQRYQSKRYRMYPPPLGGWYLVPRTRTQKIGTPVRGMA